MAWGRRRLRSGWGLAPVAPGLAEPSVGALARAGRGEVLRQFSSPIVLILLVAALLSFALDSPTDGLILLVIIGVSGGLGFWQEHGAAGAVAALLRSVEPLCTVRRDGCERQLHREELVPGDLLLLTAGSAIPADARVVAERDLSVDEAALTGESFPVSKHPLMLPPKTALAHQRNMLHAGTHVVSGNGSALVVATGAATSFGAMAEGLAHGRGETEFEHGVRRFGALLVELTLVLMLVIFAGNMLLQRPAVEAFLFTLALGVGLTPQLLPVILAVNLSQGARRMARRQVIVRRLAAIENFGAMDILCTDKTGTLTQGQPRLSLCCGVDGAPSRRVLAYALVNAGFASGTPNPVDQGILRAQLEPPPELEPELEPEPSLELADPQASALTGWTKLDELPFDFHRKRQSVLARLDGAPVLITKGAVESVLAVCAWAEDGAGERRPLAELEGPLRQLVRQHGEHGLRLLGLAIRPWPPAGESLPPQGESVPRAVEREAETGMTFLGLIGLADPLRPGVRQTVAELASLGVRLKIITGDNAQVAGRIAAEAGLADPLVLSGAELDRLTDAALPRRAEQVDVFAEIEPRQKQRLVSALRRAGHVVGYMGDGINDAPALQAADLVLLDGDPRVLVEGIREGRRTFANTLKDVFMATSANVGNMISMAFASLLLPYLPLLPKQILLTNLLTDLPEMTIATDRVDQRWIQWPRRWSVPVLRRFLLTFGLVSSLFDGLTLAVLLRVLGADAAQLRTGWFVESVCSAALVVLVIRTEGPLLASRPSRWLLLATAGVIVLSLLLPPTPLGRLFGFVPLPPAFLGWLALVLICYLLTAEAVKRRFYRPAAGPSGTFGASRRAAPAASSSSSGPSPRRR